MLSFCGIDVSKDRLDVMVLPEQESFAVRRGKCLRLKEPSHPVAVTRSP
jgi:hypothetical protein